MSSSVRYDFSILGKLLDASTSGFWAEVGILPSKGAQPHPLSKDEESVAEVGKSNEFGHIIQDGNSQYLVPPRSFLRMPLMSSEFFGRAVEGSLKNFVTKKSLSLGKTLTAIGNAGVTAILGAFASGGYGTWPAISDYTKAEREHRGNASTDPLVDTGTLRDSIEFRLKEARE